MTRHQGPCLPGPPHVWLRLAKPNEAAGGGQAGWRHGRPREAMVSTEQLSGSSTSPLRHFATLSLKRGQSMLEMTVLLVVVTLALVSFFSFIRSAVSSRVKSGADTFGYGLQHDGR